MHLAHWHASSTLLCHLSLLSLPLPPTPNNLDPLPCRSSLLSSLVAPPLLHCYSSLTLMARTTTRYERTVTTATLMCNIHAKVDCCVVEE